MAKNLSSFKTKSFIYDFAVNGGLVSTIGMNTFVSNNIMAVGCLILPITPLASGGNALIDVGVIVGSAFLSIRNVFMGLANKFMDYNIATFGFGTILYNLGVPLPFGAFVPTNIPNVISTSPTELSIRISVANLTAGKFMGTVFYVEL